MPQAVSATEQARLFDVFLQGKTARAPNHPVAYAMAGVPGAGKTSFVTNAIADGRFPSHAYILNPDHVIHALSGFQLDKETHGLEAASKRWEMVARDLAHELADRAREMRVDVIVDMGHVRDRNWDYLRDLRADGYAVHMFLVLAPVDVCAARLAARAGTQFYPREGLIKRAHALSVLLPACMHEVDTITAFDNTDAASPFRPINAWAEWMDAYARAI